MYAVHAFDDRSTSGSNISLSVHFILPMASQASLKELWLHGNAGCLSAREQLKAWALRKAWKEHNDGTYGMYAWIAEKLTKQMEFHGGKAEMEIGKARGKQGESRLKKGKARAWRFLLA